MDSSDSLQIDEHLARLLAAYDQGIDGGDGKAPTISVPDGVVHPSPFPGERLVKPLTGSVVNEGSVGEVLPDSVGRNGASQSPLATPPPSNGSHRIGRFELRRQLGKGGCGIVFLAFDPKLEREVALKIPRPEMLLSSDARKRLVREALAAAEFDHPNLVPVYETGEIGPVCFIATAFCPGQTLGEWLDKQSYPIPVRQAARLVATVAEAVQHAHDRGVLHRDLKPNNVILQATKEDPNEQEPPPGSCLLRNEQYVPRVVDFGLAKLIERGGPSETHTRQILGTPKYMAPEQAQARHDDVGPPADVYALGVILYEMLSGRAPYEGATDVEVLRQSVEANLTHPRHIRSDIPRDLEAICLKAMAKSPDRRYRTAIDLADDLRRFLDGKPTLARPLNFPGRAVRWFRRNDQLVALVVVTTIAVVLLAFGSWSMYQTRQLKEDQTRTADEQARRAAEQTQTERQREYARNVREAFLAWRAGDRRAALDALDTARKLASTGGEGTDFPHAHLSALLHADRLAIVCPAESVTALAVSADGKRLASGHADGTLTLWDRATGNLLASHPAHAGGVTHIAFALGGKRLVTIGAERNAASHVHAWTVSIDGKLSPVPEPGGVLARDATCLDVAPDGESVFIGTADGWLQLIHLVNPTRSRSVRMQSGDAVAAVSALADGGALVATNRGRLLRFTAGLDEQDTRTTFNARITALAADTPFAGYSLGFADGTIFANPPIGQGLAMQTGGRVSWLARLPEGGLATSDGTGRVLVLLKESHSLTTGDAGVVRAGAVTRDGKTLFTAGDDGIIRSWSIPDDLRNRAVRSGVPAVSVGIHPEGQRVAVVSPRSLRDHFGTDRESVIPVANERGFAAVQVTGDGATLCVEFRERAVVVRPAAPGASELARFELPEGTVPVSAQLTADASVLAVGDDHGRVFVWNVNTKSRLATIDGGSRRPVRRFALSDDGRLVAVPAAESTIAIWSVNEQALRATIPGDEQTVFQFVPTGDWLITAGLTGVLRIWVSSTGREEIALYGHVGRVTGLGVSPDGRTIVSGSVTGEVKFWDWRTGQEIMSLRRNAGPVTIIKFASKGKLMVTAGDRDVALWEVRE